MGSDFQCPSLSLREECHPLDPPSCLPHWLCADVPLAPLTVRLWTASVLGGKDPEPRTSLDMGPDDATNSARSPLLHTSHATPAVSRLKPPEDLHFLSHFPKGPDGKVQA